MTKLKKFISLLLLLNSTLLCAGTELVLNAALPKKSFAEGPSAGQFKRADRPQAQFPNKQPILGFSAILATSKPNIFWCLTDNGFGRKNNSADFIPRLYEILVSQAGKATYQKRYLQFTDPNKKLSFPIQADYEHYYNDVQLPKVDASIKQQRILTGADIDPESIQIDSNHHLWIGEEFGPFLIETDHQGRVLNQAYEIPGVYSKEHPLKPSETANLGSSGGIEAMAISPDKQTLHLILQQRVKSDAYGLLRLYTFSISNKQFESDYIHYPIEPSARVTDMVAIDDHRFYVLERNPKQQANLVYEIDLRNIEQNTLQKRLIFNLNQWIPERHTLETIEMIGHDQILLVNDNDAGEATSFSFLKSDLLQNNHNHRLVSHEALFLQQQQPTLSAVKFNLKQGYFHDNDLIGWLLTAMYSILLLIYLRIALLANRYKVDRWLWLSLAVFILIVALNKQLDIQTDITNYIREIARTDGWYEYRAGMQKLLLGLGVIISLIGFWAVRVLFKDYWIKYKALWIGFAILLAYIATRLISWHTLDSILRHDLVGGIKVNQMLELSVILFLMTISLKFNMVYFDKANSIQQRHFHGIYTIFSDSEYIYCPACYTPTSSPGEDQKNFKCKLCGYKFQTRQQ